MRFFEEKEKRRGKPRAHIREVLSILPLRNTVIYPGVVVPLTIGRSSSLQLVEDALQQDKIIGIITQRDPKDDNPNADDLFYMGTAARILRVIQPQNSSDSVIAHIQGLQRIRIVQYLQMKPYITARIEPVDEERGDSAETQTLLQSLRDTSIEVIESSSQIPQEVSLVVQKMESPSQLTDLMAAYLNISITAKEELLECIDLRERTQKVLQYARKELQVLQLNRKIQNQISDELEQNQRDYYLRKQIKAIKQEMDFDEDEDDEISKLRTQIEEMDMPIEVKKEALKEIKRLSHIPTQSAEYTVARTYIDWILDLPWSISTEDSLDIPSARKILDEDHYGLKRVKKRILEYLAVRKLKNNLKGPILCFAGPPGVGKTSLGRSIARAMGREFVRVALGGVKDESEIRGHRRTYVGALPGRIIKGLKQAGSNNPVFMLDEIDKLSNDTRGDPSSALLEVLDPEQNDTFSDHYLELTFDLSKILFIATANLLDAIPHALRDRMEVIEIAGYTENEKKEISLQYLIGKQHKEHGLEPNHITFTDEALKILIRNYTREAGIRNLEREIASVCRGIAMKVAEGETEPQVVSPEDLVRYLGPTKYSRDLNHRIKQPGVSIGLGWTPVGGEILFIESTRMKGKGELILTGQLGDVMKESAQASLSYIRTNAALLDITSEELDTHDLHIHIPSGAVPKDGPSAGTSLFTSVLSLLTNRKVRSSLAMTGEITLHGMVLPVGGVKEKILAAHQAGIKDILIPEKNEKDLVDIAKEIKETINIHMISHIEDVIRHAFPKQDSSQDE